MTQSNDHLHIGKGFDTSLNWNVLEFFLEKLCGEGGIRTHDTVAGIPPFQGGQFNRSCTSPNVCYSDAGPTHQEKYLKILELKGFYSVLHFIKNCPRKVGDMQLQPFAMPC